MLITHSRAVLLTLMMLAATIAVVLWLPDCFAANCRRPFAWRWRRLDDGKRHPLCARCAAHIDRLRKARRRTA